MGRGTHSATASILRGTAQLQASFAARLAARAAANRADRQALDPLVFHSLICAIGQ